jgi:RHS repeat-associated protein
VAVSPAQASGTYKISVTTPGGTSAAVPSDLFNDVAVASGTSTYNADGLRVTETSASGTKSFTWDSTPSVPEILNDGTNSYIYGPGGLPIEQISGSGTPSYFFQDADGSTRALLTSTGAIGATYSYTPYGSVKKSTGTLQTPLLYAQSYSDPATGLVYLINRYYNPGTAQFTSEDPDLSATDQPYEYSGDDPVNEVDPTGLFPWGKILDGVGVAAAVVGLAFGGSEVAIGAGLIVGGVELGIGLVGAAENNDLLGWSLGGIWGLVSGAAGDVWTIVSPIFAPATAWSGGAPSSPSSAASNSSTHTSAPTSPQC